MTLEQLVVEAHGFRANRLEIQKQADLLEQKEKDCLYEIQKRLEAAGNDKDGMIIHFGDFNLEVKKKPSPVVDSWPDLLQFIRDTGQTDLLQKRLTESAVKQRWDNGDELPGVSKTDKVTLKITKE